MQTVNLYDDLAALLRYPGADYAERAARCAQRLAGSKPAAAARVAAFANAVAGHSTEELQELFTRTFDLNPVCSLEIGWHLFGENYERGELLVKLRGLLRRHGITESQELPDHLSHVLELFGRMDPEEADDFAAACLYPALEKMRGAWRDTDNPYRGVLEATALVLESRSPLLAGVNPRNAPALRVWGPGGLR